MAAPASGASISNSPGVGEGVAPGVGEGDAPGVGDGEAPGVGDGDALGEGDGEGEGEGLAPGVAPGEGEGDALGVGEGGVPCAGSYAEGAAKPARTRVEESAKKLMRRAKPTRPARSREGRNELCVRVVALFCITS